MTAEPLPGTDRLHGYRAYENTDPFEDHAGPYFFKEHEDGTVTCAFVARDVHCNGSGNLHGGALMTFADFSLFALSRPFWEGPGVTISFNSEFIAAAQAGAFIEARGGVVRQTGSLLFIRGEVFTGETVLLPFTGIIKKIRPKS